MSLLACASCTRHVRRTESVCPFCKSALSVTEPTERSLPRARLNRAATFAFGAALSTNVIGCPATTTTDTGPSEVDTGGIAPAYGTPADIGTGLDAGGEVDTGGIAPMYGTPPDAGTGNDTGVDTGGGIAPAYGAPPEP